MDLDSLPFFQARHSRAVARPRAVTHVVLHTAECSESKGAARAVAGYFATVDRPASAHYVVDNLEVVQCVRLDDVAFAAPPLNEHGVHIELTGRASQTALDWSDAYSVAQLYLAADLVAALLSHCSLPLAFCDSAALLRGERGLTGHAEVSRAWKKSDHTDPGKAFPWAAFVALVGAKMLG